MAPKKFLCSSLIMLIFLLIIPNNVIGQNDCSRAKDWLSKGVSAKNHDRAIFYFDKAIGLCPDLIDAYLHKSARLGEIRNHKEAMKVAKDGLDIDPFSPELHFTLGMTYYFQSRFKESKIEVEKAIELGLTNEKVWVFLGRVQSALGDYNSAVQAYENAYKENKSSMNLGRITFALVRAGRYQECEQKANQCIERFNEENRGSCYNSLAILYAASTDPKYHDGQKAVKLMNKVIKIYGERWFSLNNLALAQARTGDFSLAVENQTKALQLLGKMENYPESLRKQYLKIGRLSIKKYKNHEAVTLDAYKP